MKNSNDLTNFKNGFSLVELLVCVMVISIIAVAFAPIITKRLHQSTVTVSNTEKQEEEEKSEDPGYKVFIPSTEGCTDKGDYSECPFTVPKGIDRINVVAVSSGAGGAGGVKSSYSSCALSHSFPHWVYEGYETHCAEVLEYDPNKMRDLKINVFSGGSGAGGKGQTAKDLLVDGVHPCLGGGSGAGAGSLDRPIDIATTYNYNGTGTLKKITYSLGKAGRGVSSACNETNFDGGDGEDSFLYITYCRSDNSCFDITYIAKGGGGGQGGQRGEDVVGRGGVITTPLNPYYATKYESLRTCHYGVIFKDPSGAESYVEESCQQAGVDGKMGGETVYGLYTPTNYIYNTSETCISTGGYSSGNPGGGWSGRCGCSSLNSSGSGAPGMLDIGYYDKDTSCHGAAGSGGPSGTIQHVENIKVTPGATCTIVVGKGGKGGGVGQPGKKGHETYIDCPDLFKLTSTVSDFGSNGVGTAQTSTELEQSGGAYGSYTYGTYYEYASGKKAYNPSYIPAGFSDTMFNYVKSTSPVYGGGYCLEDRSNCIGGSPQLATKSEVYTCGGLDTESKGCNNVSYDGTTYASFKTPNVKDIKDFKYYGEAGGGGGGGAWEGSTNTPGKGGDGQDGYLLLWWGEQN